MNSLFGKRIDDRSEQRVVAAVFLARDEMGVKRADPVPVGQVLEPRPRLIEPHLMNFSGHRGISAAVTAEETDRAADSGQTHPSEAVADRAQDWIRMVLHTKAVHLMAAAF